MQKTRKLCQSTHIAPSDTSRNSTPDLTSFFVAIHLSRRSGILFLLFTPLMFDILSRLSSNQQIFKLCVLHVFVICLHVCDFSLLLRLELLESPFPTGLILTAQKLKSFTFHATITIITPKVNTVCPLRSNVKSKITCYTRDAFPFCNHIFHSWCDNCGSFFLTRG